MSKPQLRYDMPASNPTTQEEPVPPTSATVTAEELARSPAWLPLDAPCAGSRRLVRLDEAAYRAASFLDQRLLATNPPVATVTASTVTAAATSLAPGAHYLFHIGHVGSTLVSRLIGEFPELFSVREPTILRHAAAHTVAHAADLRDALSLLARTWRPGQHAVIKATSFVSDIAVSILELDAGAASVLMFTPAPAYLRCILGGPNSRAECRALAPARLARLRRRLGEGTLGPDPQSEGQWIAMSWLCEMICLQEAAQHFSCRILWVDFDQFLAAPLLQLQAIVRALGANPQPRDIEGILAGPLMYLYSKAPEHAYDAALRQEVLVSAEREHPAEIRRGMAWLEALGARLPAVAAALGR